MLHSSALPSYTNYHHVHTAPTTYLSNRYIPSRPIRINTSDLDVFRARAKRINLTATQGIIHRDRSVVRLQSTRSPGARLVEKFRIKEPETTTVTPIILAGETLTNGDATVNRVTECQVKDVSVPIFVTKSEVSEKTVTLPLRNNCVSYQEVTVSLRKYQNECETVTAGFSLNRTVTSDCSLIHLNTRNHKLSVVSDWTKESAKTVDACVTEKSTTQRERRSRSGSEGAKTNVPSRVSVRETEVKCNGLRREFNRVTDNTTETLGKQSKQSLNEIHPIDHKNLGSELVKPKQEKNLKITKVNVVLSDIKIANKGEGVINNTTAVGQTADYYTVNKLKLPAKLVEQKCKESDREERGETIQVETSLDLVGRVTDSTQSEKRVVNNDLAPRNTLSAQINKNLITLKAKEEVRIKQTGGCDLKRESKLVTDNIVEPPKVTVSKLVTPNSGRSSAVSILSKQKQSVKKTQHTFPHSEKNNGQNISTEKSQVKSLPGVKANESKLVSCTTWDNSSDSQITSSLANEQPTKSESPEQSFTSEVDARENCVKSNDSIVFSVKSDLGTESYTKCSSSNKVQLDGESKKTAEGDSSVCETLLKETAERNTASRRLPNNRSLAIKESSANISVPEPGNSAANDVLTNVPSLQCHADLQEDKSALQLASTQVQNNNGDLDATKSEINQTDKSDLKTNDNKDNSLLEKSQNSIKKVKKTKNNKTETGKSEKTKKLKKSRVKSGSTEGGSASKKKAPNSKKIKEKAASEKKLSLEKYKSKSDKFNHLQDDEFEDEGLGRDCFSVKTSDAFSVDSDWEEIEIEEMEGGVKKKKLIVRKKGAKMTVTPLELKPPSIVEHEAKTGQITRQLSQKRLSLVDEDLGFLEDRKKSITDEIIVEEAAVLDNIIHQELKEATGRRKSSLGLPALEITASGIVASPAAVLQDRRRELWKNQLRASAKTLGKFFKPTIKETQEYSSSSSCEDDQGR